MRSKRHSKCASTSWISGSPLTGLKLFDSCIRQALHFGEKICFRPKAMVPLANSLSAIDRTTRLKPSGPSATAPTPLWTLLSFRSRKLQSGRSVANPHSRRASVCVHQQKSTPLVCRPSRTCRRYPRPAPVPALGFRKSLVLGCRFDENDVFPNRIAPLCLLLEPNVKEEMGRVPGHDGFLRLRLFRQLCHANHLFHHIPMHVRQPEIAALERT